MVHVQRDLVVLDENLYKNINKIYVEFHDRFFISELEKYKNLKEYYKKYFNENNVSLEEWI